MVPPPARLLLPFNPDSMGRGLGMLRVLLGAIGLVLLGLTAIPLQLAFFLASEGRGLIKFGQFLLIAVLFLSVSALLLWKATMGWRLPDRRGQ